MQLTHIPIHARSPNTPPIVAAASDLMERRVLLQVGQDSGKLETCISVCLDLGTIDIRTVFYFRTIG
jgi:hypothetical protein